MLCPICEQEMTSYKEEPCYSKQKQIEYKRTFYRCRKDDIWGRLEVPVGPYTPAVAEENETPPSS